MSDEKPVLLGKGRYAIYQTADGEGVISYRQDHEDKDSHQVIPANVWSMIGQVLRGEKPDMSPLKLARMLMGK